MTVKQEADKISKTLYVRAGSSISVIRLSLSRRLVNLLPVAQGTNAFTNGVVGSVRCV